MEKQFRLRKNYQFNYLYKNGKSVNDENLVVIFCKNKNDKPKVGFSVSKKYGKAVRRNKVRRRLREIINQLYPELDKRYNYVFLPRIKQNEATFSQLKESAEKLTFSIKGKS